MAFKTKKNGRGEIVVIEDKPEVKINKNDSKDLKAVKKELQKAITENEDLKKDNDITNGFLDECKEQLDGATAATAELSSLTSFLMEAYPDEMNKGDLLEGQDQETVTAIAIRLLTQDPEADK